MGLPDRFSNKSQHIQTIPNNMANFKPKKLNSSPDLVVGHVLFFIYISIIVIIVIVRKEMTKKSREVKTVKARKSDRLV